MAGKLKTSKFVNPKGRPVGPKGEELYECDNCGKLWRYQFLEDGNHHAQDLFQRITDGEPASIWECPGCGAMVFPARGEPAEIIVGLYATQKKILGLHDGHELSIAVDKGGTVKLLCNTCGNKVTRNVDESEISKVEEQEEES